MSRNCKASGGDVRRIPQIRGYRWNANHCSCPVFKKDTGFNQPHADRGHMYMNMRSHGDRSLSFKITSLVHRCGGRNSDWNRQDSHGGDTNYTREARVHRSTLTLTRLTKYIYINIYQCTIGSFRVSVSPHFKQSGLRRCWMDLFRMQRSCKLKSPPPFPNAESLSSQSTDWGLWDPQLWHLSFDDRERPTEVPLGYKFYWIELFNFPFCVKREKLSQKTPVEASWWILSAQFSASCPGSA